MAFDGSNPAGTTSRSWAKAARRRVGKADSERSAMGLAEASAAAIWPGAASRPGSATVT